ncbi:MAG: DsbA family protein [Proteobacteria bacterium]|nr:DsbA family protein [Pseudomonadota bacterium]
MVVDWYFDFVSPFAYLQWQRLGELPASVRLVPRPVLLAGILDHWGQRGPAEIAPKRLFTYQHVTWLAARRGVALRFPAGHPFNPLPLLRLALALGPSTELVGRLFRFVWVDGHLPQEPGPWSALLAELGAVETHLSEQKEPLRRATQEAVAAGVFGVPTALVDRRLFWGDDATEMLLDYCRAPDRFDSESMRRAATIPVAAARDLSGR